MVPIEFQSTHPHGVRPLSMHIYKYNDRVSIHAPTRGATQCRLQHQRIWLVSIHAPTRGATMVMHHERMRYDVSIHAPTRGATTNDGLCIFSFLFQSTHPHGVRPPVSCWADGVVMVSIHAPTRGATHLHGPCVQGHDRFNPRTHTGCDMRLS